MLRKHKMVTMREENPKLCQYHQECSGCSLWHLPMAEQLKYKENKIRSYFANKQLTAPIEIKMLGPSEIAYRDRIDVSLIDGNLGFFAKDGLGKRIVDIQECLILSPELRKFFLKFREHLQLYRNEFMKMKLSFRLRVSPLYKWGLWIDTSHVTVKYLLIEKTFLQGLLSLGVKIEIGQKLKPLVINQSGELKLHKDSQVDPWFATFTNDEVDIPIFSEIGAFTQPSVATNKIMLQEVHQIISKIENHQGKFDDVIELFSGNGNFSLAFLSRGLKVKSYEHFIGAEKNLCKTLVAYPHFQENIKFFQLNLYGATLKNSVAFSPNSLFFVDPPRSGIGKVYDLLSESETYERPNYFLYISCESKSLVEDICQLRGLGYEIQSLTGVDQFLFSEHSEWICLLKKSDI